MAAAGRSLRYNPRTMRPLAALLCALLAIPTLSSQKKKKEEETQTLRLPEELPSAVSTGYSSGAQQSSDRGMPSGGG